MKAVTIAEDLGLKRDVDYGIIADACLTELEPEEDDGTTITGIWFKPLPDDVAHKISKKYQLYKGAEESVQEDDEEKYILTEWGCLYMTLLDYGIDADKISGKVGKHIVEDFMDLMISAGHAVRNEECDDCESEV